MYLEQESNILDEYGVEAIYHMTHIDNVKSILEYGLLAHGNRYIQKDISDQAVNSRRAKIHTYVPFYLNPKNAMLYRRREIQDEIVIFAFDRAFLFEEKTLFTDGNAASYSTKFYSDIQDLASLPWGCLRDSSWNRHDDGRRKRMAEVLVPHHVSMRRVKKIFCNSWQTYQQLVALVNGRIQIECNQKFYF